MSFNDYPLGEIEGRAGISSGGADSGAAGSGGVLPIGGSTTTMAGSMPEGGETSAKPLGSLLDDFEDDNTAIPRIDGRSGDWYTGNDTTGTQTPAPGEPPLPIPPEPARAGSNGALHTFGGSFEGWGGLIGTALSNGEYDMSGYQGIRLWVRLGSFAPGVAHSMRLNLPAPATNSETGLCSKCTDHFGAVVPLTAEWRQVTVYFKDLKQEGWGVPLLESPDLAHVTSLQFGLGTGFDVWLDDIELF